MINNTSSSYFEYNVQYLYMNKAKQRYIKYKNKYEALKNQKSGAEESKKLYKEVLFWGNQMLEHAIFMDMGLNNDYSGFKNQPRNLVFKWDEIMTIMFGDFKWSFDFPWGSRELSDNVENLVNDNKPKLIKLLNETIEFIDNILNHMPKSYSWTGWLYPSFLKHMKDETIYFLDKVEGRHLEDEIQYIIKHHSEEIAVIAKLLDPEPKNDPIVKLLESYAKKAMNITWDDFVKFSEINFDENFREIPFSEWDDYKLNLLNKGDPSAAYLYSADLWEITAAVNSRIGFRGYKSIMPEILGRHALSEFIYFTGVLHLLIRPLDDTATILNKLKDLFPK